jgi:hypothetical protein
MITKRKRASSKFWSGRSKSFFPFSSSPIVISSHTAPFRREPIMEKKRKLNADFLLTEEKNEPVEVRFAANVSEKKYRFFEVSQSLLLEMNQGCRIVGDNTSEAVLCTSSKTYSIKKVETSNSIYLVPPSLQSQIYWLTQPYREYYEVHPDYSIYLF